NGARTHIHSGNNNRGLRLGHGNIIICFGAARVKSILLDNCIAVSIITTAVNETSRAALRS
ncbi:MAG TPA: hypothetical protein VI750_13295, partial [Pyrinomonadaceae bacterium]|nr:hypothetical protein [Pyrinomonadaceae bacterium]